jgi:hypothetical protein
MQRRQPLKQLAFAANVLPAIFGERFEVLGVVEPIGAAVGILVAAWPARFAG